VRYGALSVPEGYIELRWSVSKVEGVRTLHLQWTEISGPPVTEPKHKGFGSTLLQRVLPMQCNAEVEVTYDEAGLRFRMDAPLIEQRLVPEY
jgi:two-component sensor histidine kinase